MAYHGTDCQPDWIVERADGENDALGFFSDDRAKGRPVEVEWRLFRARPLVDAVIGNFAVADGRVEFEAAARDDGDRQRRAHRVRREKGNAQGCLESWTTEVSCKRLFETVIVVLEEIGKLEDLGLAGLDGPEFASSETLAQVGMDLGVG